MPRRKITALTATLLAATVPHVAQAYIGPGAGLSAIGTIVALIGAILLVIAGFVWYPIKRLTRKRTEARDRIKKTDEAGQS